MHPFPHPKSKMMFHHRMQHTTSNADSLVYSPTLHLSVPNQASCEIRSQATSDGTNQASCDRTNTVLYRPSHQRIPNDVSSRRCVPHLEVFDDVSSHRCVPYASEIQNYVSSQRCVPYDEVPDDAPALMRLLCSCNQFRGVCRGPQADLKPCRALVFGARFSQ